MTRTEAVVPLAPVMFTDRSSPGAMLRITGTVLELENVAPDATQVVPPSGEVSIEMLAPPMVPMKNSLTSPHSGTALPSRPVPVSLDRPLLVRLLKSLSMAVLFDQ
jgi:hypothetical protein